MLTVEIGLLIALASVIFTGLGYFMNKNKSVKDDGRQSAEMHTQLQYISKGVDEIRIDQKASERQLQLYGERITRVEGLAQQANDTAKMANERINHFEKKEGNQ